MPCWDNGCPVLAEAMLSLELQSGVLLAVPIPEEHAAAGKIAQDAVCTAVAQAR